MSGYRALRRELVCIDYRAYRVCGMGPPSSGAIAVGVVASEGLRNYPDEARASFGHNPMRHLGDVWDPDTLVEFQNLGKPLQVVLGNDFTLVPLAVGQAGPDEVAEVLERLWGGAETLIVISSDLSHYLPYEQAQARIAAALAAGGRMVRDEFAPSWWTLADPAGNEADIATVKGRE